MQRFLYIMLFATLPATTPAWSLGITSNCESQARPLKGTAHDKFLVSCLAQESAPEHVGAVAEQKKRKLCEQNAKNQNLAGDKQSAYLNHCMNSNEAMSAANKLNAHSPALAKTEPVQRKNKIAAAPNKPVATGKKAVTQKVAVQKHAQPATCTQQADRQKLKDDTRKKFMHACRKE